VAAASRERRWLQLRIAQARATTGAGR
jgi:hypothetical protein